jgi:hypothetical protein
MLIMCNLLERKQTTTAFNSLTSKKSLLCPPVHAERRRYRIENGRADGAVQQEKTGPVFFSEAPSAAIHIVDIGQSRAPGPRPTSVARDRILGKSARNKCHAWDRGSLSTNRLQPANRGCAERGGRVSSPAQSLQKGRGKDSDGYSSRETTDGSGVCKKDSNERFGN